MVCPKCGSPVKGSDESCPNCGEDLDRTVDRLDDKSEDLRRMSQELKAVRESRQSFSAGETIADRFEIDEFIDRGPFGEVYRAHDAIIETDVALKVFDEKIVRTPPEQEQFLDATRAARAMTQENVVRIHDSGVHDDHPWVSMQYLEGLTLAKTIELREKKDERFTLEELEPIVTQITLALQHIGREFPHGDLDPSNVFFLPDLLKVTDGYVMAALPGEVFSERLEGSKYLAPELASGTENADARCDVYSLGTILGEMIFGSDWEPGEEPEEGEPGLWQLCERATAEDPEERYPTVEALSEDFSTLVDTGQLLEPGKPGGPAPPEVPTEPEAPEEVGAGGSDAGTRPEPDAPNAEFPEDEVATRDYDRDDPGPGPQASAGPTEEYERGGPMAGGPTTEVDRDNYPPSGVGPADELPPEPETPDEFSPERAAAPPETVGESSDDSSSRSAAVTLVGGVVAVFAAIVLAVFLFPRETAREIGVIGGGPEPDVSVAKAEEKTADAGPDVETVAAAVEAAVEGLHAAVDGAREKAEKTTVAAKSEADDDNEQKEEETKESSSGTSKEQDEESGARASTSSTSEESESKGAASSTGGGKEEEEKPSDGTDCPDGMALVEWDRGNYCIDRYEYPGAGRKPQTNVTWFQARSKCKAAGKRLCTLVEFRRACGAKYPWGDEWDATKCNTRDESGFPRSLAPSGKFKECRSWLGVYDLVGNAHEWVKEQKIAGGGFDSGKKYARCGNVSTKGAGSAAPTVGFRCCADAK